MKRMQLRICELICRIKKKGSCQVAIRCGCNGDSERNRLGLGESGSTFVRISCAASDYLGTRYAPTY